MMKRLMWLFLATLVLVACGSDDTDPDPPTPPEPLTRPNLATTASGTGGAVASVDAFATQAGLDVLGEGGNAIDAAIATAAVINVTNPFSAGIGGGGFMVIYLADEGRVITIDSRETAPAAATPDMFLEDGEPIGFFPDRISSGLSVGVPGTLAGWQLALNEYGSRPLDDLLEPAIEIAEAGFPITETFALQSGAPSEPGGNPGFNFQRFSTFPDTVALYYDDEGNPPQAGDIHRNPDLAETFRLIAREGIGVFYNGEIAEDIVATVSDPKTVAEPAFTVRSQDMTVADLANYEAFIREPTVANYRGFEVYGMGPPSSGGLTVGLILNILEGYDLGSLPREQALHYMIEASRLAYSDRGAYMADSDFINVPIEGLLSDDFAATRRALITETAGDSPEPGDPFAFQDGTSTNFSTLLTDTEGISTTHLTTSDSNGNIVSYTFTIETTGGSGMVVPGRGFLLNNELTDFSSNPEAANSVAAGKRPRSSMSPTIVLNNGLPAFAVGSPGGSTIITTVMQTILNVVDFEDDLPAAIASPRMSQRNSSSTSAEPTWDASIISALEDRGHTFSESSEIGAATGIIFFEDGTVTAASEPVRRGSGAAAVQTP
ncbi:MAG: gamma-glutamyltransferase [Deinococcota bacterium]